MAIVQSKVPNKQTNKNYILIQIAKNENEHFKYKTGFDHIIVFLYSLNYFTCLFRFANYKYTNIYKYKVNKCINFINKCMKINKSQKYQILETIEILSKHWKKKNKLVFKQQQQKMKLVK